MGNQTRILEWVAISYPKDLPDSVIKPPGGMEPESLAPPGSAIPGILQARTLEWVAISFSNA